MPNHPATPRKSAPALLSGLILSLALLGWNAWQPSPAAPARIHLPTTLTQAKLELPDWQASLLPQAAPSAHAASLAQLPDGQLLAAWFAGSREGADDVAIYLSRRTPDGNWSPPAVIASRADTARQLRRHLRKLGNPVLHVDGRGRLHLYFVSVSLGGWAGSSINHKFSDDGGTSWSPAHKLTTSPFLNISTLVRTPGLELDDGGLGLPAYHEFIKKQGEWLRLDPAGRLVDKVRLPHPRAALQPAVVALGPQQLLALLRDAGPGPGHILAASSADGGQHWSASVSLPLHNPNASVALLRLQDSSAGPGPLLLAYNPGPDRDRLDLALSHNGGQSWQPLGPVEAIPRLPSHPGGVADTVAAAAAQAKRQAQGFPEFSYPSLLEGVDGRLHLVYTWRREGIRHFSFNRAWLEARQEAARHGSLPTLLDGSSGGQP